jgi:uncharacterized protein (DUF2141 family)
MKRLFRYLFSLAFGLVFILAGCGGGGGGGSGGGDSTPTPAPAVTITMNQSSAAIQTGDTLTLTATVSSGGVTWEVSPAVGGTLAASGLTATFTATAAGTYTIKVLSDVDTSQYAETTVTVSAPPAVVVTIGVSPASETVQTGRHVALTATVSQGSVTWHVSSANVALVPNGLTADFSAAAAGTYIIRVVSDVDSTKEATSTITVTPPPPATVNSVTLNTGSASLEIGHTFNLSATVDGPGGIVWTTNAGSGSLSAATGISVTFIAPSTPGTYTVTATSDTDSSKSAAITITVTSAPPAVTGVSLNHSNQTIPAGDSVSLTATVNGAGSVNWSIAPATGGSLSTASGANTTFTSSTPGTYTVTATSDIDASKTATATITVNSPPPPVNVALDSSSATIQAGQTYVFNATVTGGATVAWNTDCGAVSPTAGLITTYTAPASAGTCTVTATATGASGSNTAQARVTVTPAPPPVVSVSISPASATVNIGSTKDLTATINGGSGDVVNWASDCGATFSPASGLSTTFTAPASSGACTVTAVSVEDSTKSGTSTINVVAPPPPVTISISPSSASISNNAIISLTATVSSGRISWIVYNCPNTVASTTSAGATTTASGESVYFAAPSSATICTVTAVSEADTTKTASSTITVTGGNTLIDWQQTANIYSVEYVQASFLSGYYEEQVWKVFDFINDQCMTRKTSSTGSLEFLNLPGFTYVLDYSKGSYVKFVPNSTVNCLRGGGMTSEGDPEPRTKYASGYGTIAAGSPYAKYLPFDAYLTSQSGVTMRIYYDTTLAWEIYGIEIFESDFLGSSLRSWKVYTGAWNTVHPADAFDVTSKTASLTCEADASVGYICP